MEDPDRVLKTGLAAAASAVWADDVRTAARRGLGRAVWIVGGTAVAAAFLVVATRLTGVAITLTFRFVLAGLVTSAAVIGLSVVPALRTSPNFSRVAESLDLAVANHNAIATALDLASSGDRSPLARLAIETGVRRLSVAAHAVPVLRPRQAWDRSGSILIATGGALLTLACWLPVRPIIRMAAASTADVSVNPGSFVSPTADLRHPWWPPPVSTPADAQSAGSPSAANRLASTESTEKTEPGLGRPSAANGSSNGNSSGVATSANGSPQANVPAGSQSLGQTAQQLNSDRAAPAASTALQAPFGRAAADTSTSHHPPQAGSGGDSDDVNSSAGDQPQAGDSSPAQPKDSRGAKASGSGGGESDQGGPSKSSSQVKGHGMSSSDAQGGRGQGSGENAPKKARGVAPLLLVRPEPDLFQGRPLPGPDERTRLQVNSSPVTGDPSPQATAAERTDAEPPVPVYRVPVESRATVDDYFDRFHQDSVLPSSATDAPQ